MTTSAGGTPGTPPSRIPLPPQLFCSRRAAICAAMLAADLTERAQDGQINRPLLICS
jgi:hypothetical protein